MRSVVLLVVSLLAAGCASPPRALRPPPAAPFRFPSASAYPILKSSIDALLPDTLFPPANAAIRIASLANGEILYDLNPGLAFTPASNEKLFTTATALENLGPSYAFTTRAYIDTTFPPTVYLRGSGDPLLRTRDIDSLASLLAPVLPVGRSWMVAGDVSFFDDLPRGPGWTWDDEPDPTGMFLTPLSVNGNSIEVLVRPGARNGDTVHVSTDPDTRYVTFENSAVTAVDSPRTSLDISRKWREHTNTLTVAGYCRPSDTLRSEFLSVMGPEWYTLTLLRERLEARGVKCAGLMLDTIPSGLKMTASVSHRLDSVLVYMNHESDNLSAENVLKAMSAERFGPPGTTERGAALVTAYLSKLGLDSTRFVVADGSGLSRYNLTSAGAIVAVLTAMSRREDFFPLWYQSLPVAGINGTLTRRMRGTGAEGNVRAKTGTLQGVISLSGYVTAADGEQLVFSMLMQNSTRGAKVYRQVQDSIASYLAGLRRSQF